MQCTYPLSNQEALITAFPDVDSQKNGILVLLKLEQSNKRLPKTRGRRNTTEDIVQMSRELTHGRVSTDGPSKALKTSTFSGSRLPSRARGAAPAVQGGEPPHGPEPSGKRRLFTWVSSMSSSSSSSSSSDTGGVHRVWRVCTCQQYTRPDASSARRHPEGRGRSCRRRKVELCPGTEP